MNEQSKLKAIIIGAGIGGLTAGIALKQLGHEVHIFERVDEVRDVGAGISLWKNALAALQSVGMTDTFLQSGVAEPMASIRTPGGETLLNGAADPSLDGMGDLVRVFHRADLQQALIAQFGQADIQLGKSCLRFTQNQDQVTAFFDDGTTASGDYLIGADGINSVIRQQVHGKQRPDYAGYTAWRAIIPFEQQQLAPGETWGAGTRFGQLPIGVDRAYWFATHSEPAGGRTPAGAKAHLLDLFANWHAPIPDLIEATDESLILRNDIFDRPPLKQWGQGQVTLLGDAAHPMTPNLGQGACQAIEDGIVLRNQLKRHSSLEGALRNYEQVRIKRTTQFVLQSRRIGAIGQWRNPIAVYLRNALVKLVPVQLQANQLLRQLAFDPTH